MKTTFIVVNESTGESFIEALANVVSDYVEAAKELGQSLQILEVPVYQTITAEEYAS
jgi:hypothetical protein